VGADLLMGAGIAVEFRERFGHLAYLKSLKRRPGQVATLPLEGEGNKYIFNIVTKPRSAHCLPREEEFRPAVQELANLCASLGVQTLAMPQIGAGLDRQPWRWAKNIIEEAFAGIDTDVLIFLHPSEYPRNECRSGHRNRRTHAQAVKDQNENQRETPANSQQQTADEAANSNLDHASLSDFPELGDTNQTKTKVPQKKSPTERFVGDLEKSNASELPRTPVKPAAAEQSNKSTPYGTPESPEDTSAFYNRLKQNLGRSPRPRQPEVQNNSEKNYPPQASSNGK